jgi:hypothetical protein
MSLRNTAGINYPRDIKQCIKEDFEKLKRHQEQLQRGLIAALFTRGVTRSRWCDREQPLASTLMQIPTIADSNPIERGQ